MEDFVESPLVGKGLRKSFCCLNDYEGRGITQLKEISNIKPVIDEPSKFLVLEILFFDMKCNHPHTKYYCSSNVGTK